MQVARSSLGKPLVPGLQVGSTSASAAKRLPVKRSAHSIGDDVEKGDPQQLNASPRAKSSNSNSRAKGKARRQNGRRKMSGGGGDHQNQHQRRGVSTSMLGYVRNEFSNEMASTKGAASTLSRGEEVEEEKEEGAVVEGGFMNGFASSADPPSVQRLIVDDPESLAHIDVDELQTILKGLEEKDNDLKQGLREQRALLRQAIRNLNSMNAQLDDIDEEEEEKEQQLEQQQLGEEEKSHSLPVTSKSCEIVHPGAECCTRTMVSMCPSENRGTVTIQASVEPHTSAKQDLNTQDMIALAALAIERAGTKLFAHESHTLRKKKRDSGRHSKHLELTKVLQHGKIVSSRRSDHTSEFGHESFLVELEDEDSGKRIKAMFKPKSEEGEESGWHRVEVEGVAYQLNLLLGMDYIPPSAVRKGDIIVDGREFEEGCFTYFVEGARQLNEVNPEVWAGSKEVFLSDTRILDVLIHNSDRHHGHFLYGKHWLAASTSASSSNGIVAGGLPSREMGMSTFLIDHAAGFRREACVRMDHENAFTTGPTRKVSARTYLHLRYLTYDILEAKLSPYLNLSEICELNRRKEAILDYFDGLVFFDGYDSVVMD
jgi:hypothetical protein